MSFKIGDKAIACLSFTGDCRYGTASIVKGESYVVEATADNGQRIFINGQKGGWWIERDGVIYFTKGDPFKSTKASRKLANDAMKEVKEYQPQIVEV